MKKNNPYITITDDEIDLGDLVRTLWREKILILSISIVFGLLGYLYASFIEEFKIEIKLKNPPSQIFEPYTHVFTNNNNNNIAEQFISDFKLNLLSLDNLETFVEESRDLDTFKKYLKSRNISTKQYFAKKLGEVKQKNIINPNEYFLIFTKELDGDIFLNNYIQFIKKKTIFELKKNLKLSIINKITSIENAIENAKIVNLENPILLSPLNQTNYAVNIQEDLFYKGSKVLSQEIIFLKRLMIKLENDQFNFEIILDKPLDYKFYKTPNLTFFVIGIILGLFLSLGIIYLRGALKNN
jgi:LPS O-antigen subunit length determinant protein (WzzB/FepE family)